MKRDRSPSLSKLDFQGAAIAANQDAAAPLLRTGNGATNSPRPQTGSNSTSKQKRVDDSVEEYMLMVARMLRDIIREYRQRHGYDEAPDGQVGGQKGMKDRGGNHEHQ